MSGEPGDDVRAGEVIRCVRGGGVGGAPLVWTGGGEGGAVRWELPAAQQDRWRLGADDEEAGGQFPRRQRDAVLQPAHR